MQELVRTHMHARHTVLFFVVAVAGMFGVALPCFVARLGKVDEGTARCLARR